MLKFKLFSLPKISNMKLLLCKLKQSIIKIKIVDLSVFRIRGALITLKFDVS